jgi:hypothetical protein
MNKDPQNMHIAAGIDSTDKRQILDVRLKIVH